MFRYLRIAGHARFPWERRRPAGMLGLKGRNISAQG